MAAVFCRRCGAESPADSLFCMKCGARQQGQSASSSLGEGADRDGLVGQMILEYRIESKLGEGGMGAVYLGRHEALDQEVAIKVLNPLLARNRELVDRFIQEARIQVSLRHANIVSVLTAVTTGPHMALIMEYVSGISLEQVLERRKQLPIDEALHLFRQVLEAVGYAHVRGVVHRDIKPANLMVQADGTAKVMDFGIAKVLGADKLTRTGTSMGSAHYMAPEQILGRKDLDYRADIYALGVTLFESLTGRVPFDVGAEHATDSDFLVKQAHVQMAPPSPKNFRPEIPEHVARAVLTAMSKDPAQRFQSCAEFTEALLPLSSSAVRSARGQATAEPLVKGGELPSNRPVAAPIQILDHRELESQRLNADQAVPVPIASLRSRFWASIIDTLVLILLAIVPLIFLVGANASEAVVGGLMTAIFVAYETRMLSDSGQTVGKKAMGIKVVALDGSNLSSGKAFGRSLTRGLLNLIPYVGWFIDLIPIFADRKQCIHDLMAGTLVVRCR